MDTLQSDVTVAIATSGRRELVGEIIKHLQNQELAPAEVIVCPASPDDVSPEALASLPFPTRLVSGPRGLPAQRNAALAAVQTSYVLFLDDDFLCAPGYLAELQALFEGDSSIGVVTGRVIRDGILGPGIPLQAGLAVLDADVVPAEASALSEVYNGYGCNMAFRMEPVRAHGLRFDERLPLYGWLEDVDFSRQVIACGWRAVRTERCRGVHLGNKTGRTSGTRLGYSQVANPWYLTRKGTLDAAFSARHVFRNFAMNIFRSARPEPWVDRRGRLRGNLLAIVDLFRAKLDPGRIMSL